MPHDVFISYSSLDKAFADEVCSSLEHNGIKCWIAPRDILGGDTFGTAIINAINNCSIVIIIFSSHSNSSNFVLSEIERAVSKSKILIPVRIEEIHPSGDMELFLARRHWFDAITPPMESHFNKLSETVNHLLQKDIPNKPGPDPGPSLFPGHVSGSGEKPVTTPRDVPAANLKNGFSFIVEKEDPFYMKFRETEIPITYNNTKSLNGKANIWYSQAEKMFYNLKIEEAIRFYKRAIEEDPEFQEPYLKLALMQWLFPNNFKPEDSFKYCQTGFDVNNTHIIGSFLIFLYIQNHRLDEAENLLGDLINNKGIANINQLAGLHFLQSEIFNFRKNYEKEYENLMKANQISPFFGPALRQRARIHLDRKEFNEAEMILKNGFDEYSKYRYCRNWLNTRDLLISVCGNSGKNELALDLLKENDRIQKLMNINNDPLNRTSNIFFEGEIDGNVQRGYLINGAGFDITHGYLQDGIEMTGNSLCKFEINKSDEFCLFYDHRFGGTVVRIDNILFLMKIIQGNSTGSLVQTRNDFKLSGVESGFPNLWFICSNSTVKPINLSESRSLNLKRI